MTFIRNITTLCVYICISFYNALIEGFTALKSMWMFVWWLLNFCTYEVEIEDEDGTIIHHFPQLNFNDKDDDF